MPHGAVEIAIDFSFDLGFLASMQMKSRRYLAVCFLLIFSPLAVASDVVSFSSPGWMNKGLFLKSSPSGEQSFLIMGSWDGTVTALKLTDRKRRDLYRHHGWVSAMACDVHSNSFATGSSDGTVVVSRGLANERRQIFSVSGYLLDIAFSPDGKTLAVASSDGFVEWIHLETGKSQRLLHEDGVQSVEFSKTGNHLLTTSFEGRVSVWAMDGAFAGARVALTRMRGALARFVGSDHFVASDSDGTVQVYDLKGVVLWTSSRLGVVDFFDLSPDGKFLLAAIHSGVFQILELGGSQSKQFILSQKVKKTGDGQSIPTLAKFVMRPKHGESKSGYSVLVSNLGGDRALVSLDELGNPGAFEVLHSGAEVRAFSQEPSAGLIYLGGANRINELVSIGQTTVTLRSMRSLATLEPSANSVEIEPSRLQGIGLTVVLADRRTSQREAEFTIWRYLDFYLHQGFRFFRRELKGSVQDYVRGGLASGKIATLVLEGPPKTDHSPETDRFTLDRHARIFEGRRGADRIVLIRPPSAEEVAAGSQNNPELLVLPSTSEIKGRVLRFTSGPLISNAEARKTFQRNSPLLLGR